MAKSNQMIFNTIDGTGIVVGEDGTAYHLSDTGMDAWIYFASKDTLDMYECNDIVKMIQLLTSFQYYWLSQKGSFKGYDKHAKNVMKYIFDNYNGLKNKSEIDFNKVMIQMFN